MLRKEIKCDTCKATDKETRKGRQEKGDTHLFCKFGNIVVERLRRADIATVHARLSWCTCGEFAFLEDESQQGKERVTKDGT